MTAVASPPIQPLPAARTEEAILAEIADGARLVFCDTETTGLSPPDHQMWELGLVLDGPEGEIERHWYFAVDLERAEAEALRVGGYYERHPQALGRDWQPADPVATARELVQLTLGAHLVGVNPAFDATFLGAFIREHGQVPMWHHHLIDVLPLIAGRYRVRPPWHSRDLSRIAGVGLPADDERHTAVGDARWAKRMYEAVFAGD